MSKNKPPLLRVENLHLTLGGNKILHGMDFEIFPAERWALVGESGSGKTLTALALLGLVAGAQTTGRALWQPDPAQPALDLLRLPSEPLRQLRGREVAMIFQEPMTALNPLMRAGDQVAEVLQLRHGLSRRDAHERACALLQRTGLMPAAERAQQWPHQMSGGQRQRVMIAAALASGAQLLIADEPTTALDASLRLQMLDLLEDLQQQTRMATWLITHDLPLVRRFAQRVAVIERGRIVEHGQLEAVFAQPQHPYTQALLASRRLWNMQAGFLNKEKENFPQKSNSENQQNKKENQPKNLTAVQENPVLSVQNLRVFYEKPRPGVRGWLFHDRWSALHGVNFQLHAGRTLGIVGESGSGKSTLAQAILGLIPSEGDIQILGQTWKNPSYKNNAHNRALRRHIQVVFQDPFGSLSPRMTVRDIVGEGLKIHADAFSENQENLIHSRQKSHQPLSGAALENQILAALAEVALTPEQFPHLLDRHAHEFSGGQRQRLALARALIVGPRVLVLDEPTSALDVRTQQQVLALLAALQARRGLSYVLITHDLEVIAELAHDLIVLEAGRIVEAGPTQQLLTTPSHPVTRSLVQASG